MQLSLELLKFSESVG